MDNQKLGAVLLGPNGEARQPVPRGIADHTDTRKVEHETPVAIPLGLAVLPQGKAHRPVEAPDHLYSDLPASAVHRDRERHCPPQSLAAAAASFFGGERSSRIDPGPHPISQVQAASLPKLGVVLLRPFGTAFGAITAGLPGCAIMDMPCAKHARVDSVTTSTALRM